MKRTMSVIYVSIIKFTLNFIGGRLKINFSRPCYADWYVFHGPYNITKINNHVARSTRHSGRYCVVSDGYALLSSYNWRGAPFWFCEPRPLIKRIRFQLGSPETYVSRKREHRETSFHPFSVYLRDLSANGMLQDNVT